jgi:hypothetical protein
MRVSPTVTIDLDAFAEACLTFISLVRLPIEPGVSVLDPAFADDVDEAVDRFSRFVADRPPDVEQAIRYALAWLLNLDSERFAATATHLDCAFPVHGNLSTLRTFLGRLWDGTFASWKDPRFDPDAYRVKGLRPA